MKKVIIFVFLISFFTVVTANNLRVPNPPVLGIKISFSTKAYWDGTQCAPRDKGCCFHIELTPVPPGPGQIMGDMSYSTEAGLRLIVSKKEGVSQDTYRDLFKFGKFIVSGTGTFSKELLSKLGLSDNFSLSEGEYTYTVDGDKIIITFK